MAEIKIETGDNIQEITQFPVRIGRAVDNDIVVRAMAVADYHAIIENSPEGLQVRNLHDAQLNGKPIRSRALVRHNSNLTIGSATLKLWLNAKEKMPNAARTNKWKIFTNPFCALIWFTLAIALPVWTDYLQTNVKYVLNWQMIFIITTLILGLVWMVHSMVLPVSRRYLITPLISIISALSLFSELTDQTAYWFNFQYSFGWADTLSLIISSSTTIYLLRAFLRDFIPIGGRLLRRCTIAVSLPMLLLLTYNYLQKNDFFSQQPGKYPSYAQGLLKNIAPGKNIKTIEKFFE